MTERVRQTIDWMAAQGFTAQDAVDFCRHIDNTITPIVRSVSLAASQESRVAADAAYEAAYKRGISSILIGNLDFEPELGPTDAVECVGQSQHGSGIVGR